VAAEPLQLDSSLLSEVEGRFKSLQSQSASLDEANAARNAANASTGSEQDLSALHQYLGANVQAGNELVTQLNGAAPLAASSEGIGSGADPQFIALYFAVASGRDTTKYWRTAGKLGQVEAVLRALLALQILLERGKRPGKVSLELAGALYAMQGVIAERFQIHEAIFVLRSGLGSASSALAASLLMLEAAYRGQQRSFDAWLEQAGVDREKVVDYALKTAVEAGPQAMAAVMRGSLASDRTHAMPILHRLPGMTEVRLAALQMQASQFAAPAAARFIPAPVASAPAMAAPPSARTIPPAGPAPAPAPAPAPRYNPLPPADRTEVGLGGEGAGTITISNETDYRLEISFSGPKSAEVMIAPRGSRTLGLSEGSYEVYARLPDRPSVLPFRGTDRYTSTERYSLSFMISTRY
jgi:hypothetical protein